MEWYEILIGVVSVFGGGAGLISIYKAKSEKTGIDIDNMQTMLDESHKMYNDARAETKELRDEFSAYKEENMEYVREFKKRFAAVEERLSKAELAVFQGYRCPFPSKTEDCPVLQEFNRGHCKECSEANN